MRKVILVVGLVLLLQLALVPAISAAPPSSAGFWHRVNHGETLFSIGRMYHVNPYTICHANGLRNCNHIFAGQALWIPRADGPHPPDPPQPGKCSCVDYHTVRYGQTLYSIARHYGVSSDAIARCNGIRNVDKIYAGECLCIPGW
jgi:spore germination protein